MKMKHEFLKEKYDLHKRDEVKRAAERAEQKTGESVPENPDALIQNYLDRLERLALDSQNKQKKTTERKHIPEWLNKESRPRAITLLREMVMNRYVRPNKEKMAEGAARVEERIAGEMGIDVRYGEAELEQRGEIAVEDLEKSLDQWILYLSDANEPYPVWFRYYVFRNILNLGDYDKDKGEFTKRSPGSARLFPDIDRGALAYVEQMIEAAKDQKTLECLEKAQRATANEDIPESELITKEKAADFAKLSFAKQYADGIKQSGEITPEMREETRGKWVKYQEKTDPTALWASLQNKGTAWCTKGFGTAKTQLEGGDFYVYYTLDKQGKPTIPRIAIRMQDNKISEARGVADNDQNLEGNMSAIAEEKMKELPGAEKYRKASADMKTLTVIDKKTKRGENLTKDDLRFLYEMNSPIKGFGYKKDPRIEEIIWGRDKRADISSALGIFPKQVSFTEDEALSGDILYHYGDLDLSSLTSAEGLTLPESIGGNLNLSNLTSAEGPTLPKSIGGDLYLSNLTSAEGLTLPKSIGGDLYLRSLTSAKDLTLPKSIGGDVYLYKLTSAEGLTLPESIGGDLDLSNLTSAEGLTFPKSIGGGLFLSSLTSAEGLTLPESIGGDLDLSNLTSAEDLTFPESIGGGLYLSRLTSAEIQKVQKQYPHLIIRS